MREDFFDLYLRYAGAGVSEPPIVFHRWVALSILGTLLGRQFHFPFGHSHIYPNQYINLMGPPGARKSTAINIGKKLIEGAGFTRFAADRTSKEMFIASMQQLDDNLEPDELANLTLDEPAESFIVAEEFTDFIGPNNIEFVTMLTKLWDNMEEYKHPKITGKSIVVHQPTVNLLCGNTVQNFALAFPPEAIGNGFMSRTLFIHGETSGRKVTFPAKPDLLVRETLINYLIEIKAKCRGEAFVDNEAKETLHTIYNIFPGISDSRFVHYITRRLTHLIKLCMIMAATDISTTITKQHVLRANTVLHWAEVKMPKALGEYGKSKFAPQSSMVVDFLNKQHKPQNVAEIWKHVNKDFTKMNDLLEIIKNLGMAGRIQDVTIGGKRGYLLKHEESFEWPEELLVPGYLTDEEMIGA